MDAARLSWLNSSQLLTVALVNDHVSQLCQPYVTAPSYKPHTEKSRVDLEFCTLKPFCIRALGSRPSKHPKLPAPRILQCPTTPKPYHPKTLNKTNRYAANGGCLSTLLTSLSPIYQPQNSLITTKKPETKFRKDLLPEKKLNQ